MKKTVLITFLVVTAIIAVLWFFMTVKPEPLKTIKKIETKDTQLTTLANVINTPKQALSVKQVEAEEYNPYETQAFKEQVQLVADLYQDTARFPVNSQPIRNIADARQPEPFEETEVETPFETEDGDVIQVSASVDKFQYLSNDTINVRLNLAGVPEGEFVRATATVSGPQGDTPLKTELEAVNANQSLLLGSLDTSLVSPQLFSNQMTVNLLIDVGGEPFFTTVSFSYSTASAQLVGLGLVQPNGPNLEIPLEYNVFNSGYYFVSALLQDEQTGKPLIALQTEGRMSQGNGRLVAKAHIQALQETGSEGPYILTNIKAHRGAERGEKFDIPASTLRTQYSISGYSFSEYQDEAYQDPLAAERVELLRTLATPNNENSAPSSNEQGGESQ